MLNFVSLLSACFCNALCFPVVTIRLRKAMNTYKKMVQIPRMRQREKKNICLPPSPSFLIILMGSLGDVTRGLCLVSRLKHCFPDCTVTWLIEPKCREIVSAHPMIDHVWVFNRTDWKRGLKDILNRLRNSRFDCVLDLQRHFKSGLFSFFSGARYRLGFHPKNTKEGNWVFNNTYIPYVNEFYPKIFHYLKFTEFLGCQKSDTPSQARARLQSQGLDFGFSGDSLSSFVPDVLSEIKAPLIAIILGSTWVTKEWFFEKYLELIRELLEMRPLHMVMVDTMAKYPMASELANRINSPRLINLVGRTSILELAAVLKRATAAVGPDCGSAHIAAAVGTPYVTLFGPTSPQRTASYGSEHLVVSKNLDCAPCYKRKCPRRDVLCMRAIQVKDVKQKILEALHLTEN